MAQRIVRTIVLLLACFGAATQAAEPLQIGSKRFTESYILGEVLLRAASRAGPAEHKPGLGNTGILYAALRNGAIDVYPEYTGTIAREILKLEGQVTLEEINQRLAAHGLKASVPLGFNNGYALGMPEKRAETLGIRTIGDLARHPKLRWGLSQEFLARADGWPGLAKAYGFSASRPDGLDHGLAYEALAAGRVDVIDLYTTDAKIGRYGIRVLEDDRKFFPRYDAILLHRADIAEKHPAQWAAMRTIAGKLNENKMIELNAAAEIDGRTFAQAAALLDGYSGPAQQPPGLLDALLAPDFARVSVQHLTLVLAALLVSCVVGIPLGVAAACLPAAGRWIFGVVAVVQTIPALALLAFLVALLGTIGTVPAFVALFLYGLLPIVRNTHAGMLAIGSGLRQAASALGLGWRDRLLYIELPLAAPSMMAGIKTSAVINVGTATIAAFIGAGGYGERIASGLALNDHRLLLAGAIPAALLALALQGLFDLIEKRMIRYHD